MDALPPLLCSAGRSAIGVRTGRAFLVDALPPLLIWVDALPLKISVLRRRLCNHSVIAFLFAGSGVAVLWVTLVCSLSVLSSSCCLLLSGLCLCLVCVCVFSVFLYLFLVFCALVLIKFYLAALKLYL